MRGTARSAARARRDRPPRGSGGAGPCRRCASCSGSPSANPLRRSTHVAPLRSLSLASSTVVSSSRRRPRASPGSPSSSATVRSPTGPTDTSIAPFPTRSTTFTSPSSASSRSSSEPSASWRSSRSSRVRSCRAAIPPTTSSATIEKSRSRGIVISTMSCTFVSIKSCCCRRCGAPLRGLAPAVRPLPWRSGRPRRGSCGPSASRRRARARRRSRRPSARDA